MELDPYEAFELWARANGFADVIDCPIEDTDSDRLHEAIEAYGRA